MWQTLVVAVVVACAMTYAVWTLMPQALRRWLAGRLARHASVQATLPMRWQQALERATRAAPGCGGGCHGCDDSSAQPTSPIKEAPLVFHPSRKR